MQCECRNCHKEYNSNKTRSYWAGFCSAKCLREKLKTLGYKKGKNSEYEVLKSHKCIGDCPVEAERVKLREELVDLQKSQCGSSTRIKEIKRLLAVKA
jgi:hypothetical protein